MKISWAGGKKAGYILGDGGYKMLTVFPDVSLNDYGIYISEGGKEDAVKQAVTQLSQAALQSGSIDLLSVIKILKAETLTEAEHILEHGIKEIQEQSQQAQEMQQQQLQAQAQQADAQRQHELNLKELENQGKVNAAIEAGKAKVEIANLQADLEANVSSDKIKATLQKEAMQSGLKDKIETEKLKHSKETEKKNKSEKEVKKVSKK